MRIRLNGRVLETKDLSLYDLRRERFDERNLLIVNGYHIREDRKLREGDEVVVIQRGKMPDASQMEAMLSARHTPGVYQKLKQGKVAVAGLGGLGSNIAAALARSGVGQLLLVDFDTVEPSNLNRQSYFIRHIGRKKTEAMAEQIAEMNPFVKVTACDVRITEANAAAVFRGWDVVCEAFDGAESKAVLAETLIGMKEGPYLICGSGMAGFESANLIRSRRRMKRLYLCGDETSEAGEGRGLMMPRVQVCAGHQANMALRLLMGMEEV
ncbi:MAG: sulfur carrier protein ThiS adenylyltransferase ThiF [Peptostreptococcaceae bacterium]|nr:sulfur carrier protein ThiS adenylyltransferase ThiF [Peptostreptococcaceae bacterium]